MPIEIANTDIAKVRIANSGIKKTGLANIGTRVSTDTRASTCIANTEIDVTHTSYTCVYTRE